MRKYSNLLAIAIFGLYGLSGQAQDFHFGVQAALSSPTGDLKDMAGSGAIGGSLLLDWSLAGGHILRPRLDYTHYPDKSLTTTSLTSSTSTTIHATYSITSSGFGLDYLFYPSGKQEGWHLDLGIEEMRYSIKVRGTSTLSSITSSTTDFSGPDTTKSQLGYGLGIGYDFNQHWSMGMRFNSAKVESMKLDSFNTSIGYRF
ncbi:porin family protein [Geothrix campi]|jgi:hypothetical protein|uniref:porin family protein n=1 Tax=Geothrix campi TaxID=2966450 RepID=UPI00214940B9|nr:porin family protein [Geothrix sp. SG10]